MGTGETTESITVSPTITTTYTVIATQNGCSTTDQVTVNVLVINTIEANVGEDVTICEIESTVLTAHGGTNYLWNTGETSQNISVSPTDTTTYSVEAIINGCSNFDEVTVSVVAPVNADAGEDIDSCIGEEVILTATGGEFFEWSTGETEPSISVSPSETTVYSVSVSNGISAQTDEVMVTIENCAEINEEAIEFDYRVYPNPSNGIVKIKISGLENISGIVITDMLGKTIKMESITPNESLVIDKQYDLRSLPRGIYFITLVQSGENSITKKLILK